MSETDPFALNIKGVTNLIENDTNKVDGSIGGGEGIVDEKIDVLSLKMEDSELLKLRDKWESSYILYEGKLKPRFKKNLTSYLGTVANGQSISPEDKTTAANMQFEAEETFLAATLAKNPEPVVYADNSEEGNKIANSVKTMLQFHADQLVIRRKLSMAIRQWSIYHLGVLKYGWNNDIQDIAVDNRKIQDFIFDPSGYVDAYGDFSSYLGERITISAEKLIELYPKHGDYIKLVVEDKLGTEVVYTEWWEDDYTFVTFKGRVLAKHKNPYFNYKDIQTDMLGKTVRDASGIPQVSEPRNHFAKPRKPYVFLSVYSLQEQPHDITGLIEQNIPNQALVSNRTRQIDFNISRQNNSDVFSENNFNQETAKQAANALRKGNPVLIPSGGPINEAIIRLQAQGLSDAVFKELETNKTNMRASWGIQGISSQPQTRDTTVRGMILNKDKDSSRINGGIGDTIEQVADNIFNWLVQLYYVFYDEEHFAAIMGSNKAVEYVVLSNKDLKQQLIISVSPNSMKPKDEISNMNLAQSLFDKGAIGPKTLLTMVDFPDPNEAAADGALWAVDKMTYIKLNFPDVAQQLQQEAQQAQQGAPQGAPQGAGAAQPGQPTQQAQPSPVQPISAPDSNLTAQTANPNISQVTAPPIG